MSQVMVARRLNSIGKSRKLSRCVPHALMQYGMDRCADMSLSVHTLSSPTHGLSTHSPRMRSRFPTLTFTVVLAGLTKVRVQEAFLNPTYTPKRLCSASGGAYTASNVGSCLPRDLHQKFQIRDDIEKVLEHFFKQRSPAFWSRGTYDLPKRVEFPADLREMIANLIQSDVICDKCEHQQTMTVKKVKKWLQIRN
ncbi:hypothetical protein ANCCEY_09574 [Ancylostoma ceylanicum]|uniref:Uncharacterized protein n=1 Tax=Ancylostoma ceylanicum TaxID=53326 RepID=A0A0D6LMV1_9BILA|nr:hypothetical protein ANCCEY_09574 [Ancylostoma ceylanicum]